MTRKKLLGDVLQNPARIYRTPGDVLRDRRFDDAERLEILRAWRISGGDAVGIASDIDAVIAEIEGRFPANHHAAE